MSHNIEYYDYDYDIDKEKTRSRISEYVRMETRGEGGSGVAKIRWLDGKICCDRDAAMEMIKQNDNGWYDKLAVPYYLPRRSSKKQEELKKRVDECYNKMWNKESAKYCATRTTEFISCPHCGSKLRRTFLSNNACPVCREDLRPQYILDDIRSAKERLKKAEIALKKQIQIDQDKHAGAKMWLVKIEYHT